MSRLIEDQGNYLQLLQSISKLLRKTLLTTIIKPQLKALCEITHNLLKAVVLSPSEERKTLRTYKKILTLLEKKKSTRREQLKALQSTSTAVILLLNIAGASLWTRRFWFLTKSTRIWHPGRLQRYERNGIPNDKEKKIRTSGNSRKKKRMESVTGYHFKKEKKKKRKTN